MTGLAVFGVNHRTAPLRLRERLALPAATIPPLLERAVRDGLVAEAVILSTCNRFEVYAGADGSVDVRERLGLVVGEVVGIDRRDVAAAAYVRTGRETVAHLFRVACGLDSLVLGETQILGQVRDAFGDAAAAGSTGPVFNRLFHHALRVGKRARAESSIASGITSLPSAAIHALRAHFGGLEGRRGVLLGAGAMAGIAASHLGGQGLGDLVVVNRTVARAETVAAGCGGRASPLAALGEALRAADFLVAACSAPGPLVGVETLIGRGDRPVVLVDLSVPRVVDPALAALAAVTVFDLDALDRTLDAHRARRADAVRAVEALVAEETEAFLRWLRERESVSPLVAALIAHCDAVRRQAVERNAKFVSGAGVDGLDRFSRSLIAKLLDRPLREIRAWNPDTAEGRLRLDVIRELFGLDADARGGLDDLFHPSSGFPDAG